MRMALVTRVLKSLIEEEILHLEDSILTVCAAEEDRDVFLSFGFNDVTISNLDDRKQEHGYPPFKWSRQDAQALDFADKSFDFAFVVAGIHHCQAPHAAVVEMYRVSRKGIIVVEGRDNWLMRLATRLHLTSQYEINLRLAETLEHGGVDNSHIPNHVYRWTEREFIKTVRSFDPTGMQRFRFFYGLHLPTRTVPQSLLKKSIGPLLVVLSPMFKKLGTDFAMVALRPSLPDDLWPWLVMDGETVDLNHAYVKELAERRKLPRH